MTQHHYTVQTTEEWLESAQARTNFLDWLAGDSPDELVNTLRTTLIGWAPIRRLATVETTREWLYELTILHPVADMLYGRHIEDWLGTSREHDGFHVWAQLREPHTVRSVSALCGGCWL